MNTTVILIRHESRGANEEAVPLNCLTDAARKRAFRSGQRLAELGYRITAAYSSPQFRAIETLQWNLAGNRATGPIPLDGVDPTYGDMYLGKFPFTEEEKAQVMTDAKTAGITPEEALVTLQQYSKKAESRGREGANSIIDIVYRHLHGVIAIASHGGSRIEPIVENLINRQSGTAPTMVPPGGTVIVAFEELKDVDPKYSIFCDTIEYLGNLGIPEPLTLEIGALDADLTIRAE